LIVHRNLQVIAEFVQVTLILGAIVIVQQVRQLIFHKSCGIFGSVERNGLLFAVCGHQCLCMIFPKCTDADQSHQHQKNQTDYQCGPFLWGVGSWVSHGYNVLFFKGITEPN